MHEIKNDAFFDFIKQYDDDNEYHFVGEIDYHLLSADKPYKGLSSHREALLKVFESLFEKSLENKESAAKAYGSAVSNKLTPLAYDIDKARAVPLDPEAFFYCPNIVKTDYYGNASYDSEWRPNDDNLGTSVPHWYALMEPIHARRNKPEDFKRVNEALYPEGTDALDVYEWTTDWSDLFDDGHEWYGACCWSVYDKRMKRYVVMLVSSTD